jgi:hypothetical protein
LGLVVQRLRDKRLLRRLLRLLQQLPQLQQQSLLLLLLLLLLPGQGTWRRPEASACRSRQRRWRPR